MKSQIKKMSFQPVLKCYCILCGPQVLRQAASLSVFTLTLAIVNRPVPEDIRVREATTDLRDEKVHPSVFRHRLFDLHPNS